MTYLDEDSFQQANRLIYLSLIYSNGNRRALSQYMEEMTELLQKFRSSEPFQQLVEAGLKAMELQILTITSDGLRLSARHANSFFATTLTDYGKMLARSDNKAADLLCVHCAIATALFPNETDLDAPVEDLGVVMVEDIIQVLRRFADQEQKLPAEDDILDPQVRTAAQRIRELPEENPDSKRAGAGASWLALINRVLEHLVSTDYLLAFEDHQEDVIEYRPTPAYQAALRQAAVYAFHHFRNVATGQDPQLKTPGTGPDQESESPQLTEQPETEVN
ncbi:hypothetical protein H0A36_13010 [Endozoicomonas sp. SM1973]|uniref:Uncharacterized protein n=1 Tax=Spartinivicinus marinus TaxID=2994442 RepID=A0A853IA50_9GAMM|nr:hypothetical protein [Spartinivicinus marinus]MCX4029685.1 hypothetical protein [Spartinivicinus marinus]NYZ66934.1 hypothetical protein [Spartinivicinus marinus]